MTDRYYGEAGSYLTFMDKGEMKERKLDAATPNNAYYDYELFSDKLDLCPCYLEVRPL